MSKAKKNREKVNGFIGEFKKFIARGNIVDMAVGLIIGSAFTAIVNSLVNDVLMPLISLVKKGGFTDMYVGIIQEGVAPAEGVTLANGAIILEGEPIYRTYLFYGNFIQQIINFFLIAMSLFIMVKIINKIRESSDEMKKRIIEEMKEREAEKNKETENDEVTQA